MRLFIAFLLSGAMASAAEDKVVIALKGNDPVELCGGNERAGASDITHKHGRYTYQFANADNRAKFLKDPETYAIQFAGACMKMGPLSGSGSADRYHVHRGRIYLFASESCLKSFRTDPDAFVDAADDAVTGTAEQTAAAKVLLAKAVTALGGAKQLDALKSWEMKMKLTSTQPKNAYSYTRTTIVGGTDAYIVADDYGTSQYTWRILPGGAYVSWDKAVVEADVKAYMQRDMARQPVALLKAYAAGHVAAAAAVAAKVGDDIVENVTVSWLGATTTLGIEPKTGRILIASFRGRGGVGIQPIARHYSDFKTVDGYDLPHRVTTLVDGKPQEHLTVTVEHVKVNQDIREHLKKPTN